MKNKFKSQIIKLKKILLLVALIIVISTAIYYFFLKQFIENNITIEKEITSINIDDKSFGNNLHDELQNNDMQDVEFDKQVRINDLETRINELELKINNIDLKDEMSVLAISFAKLSYLIQQESDYQIELSKFSALSTKNYYISSEIKLLEDALDKKNYKRSKISSEFNNKIDDLILLKEKSSHDSDMLDKIKKNIANLVIIRRVDGVINSDLDKIDAKILIIEQLVKSGSFTLALNEVNNLDSKYKFILQDLIFMLENQVAINNSIKNIFSYLQKIINNV
ncbi:hypothetical protein N9O56_00835 [Rickettsiales bacterium]|nr:hypothetical protein [Rickettsiales bacterium]